MEDLTALSLSQDYFTNSLGTPNTLSELGRATTAYHDAPPDLREYARIAYEAAVREFKLSLTTD